MTRRVFFLLLFTCFVFLPRADTITFWHFHRNYDFIGENCFDKQKCFGTEIVLQKSALSLSDKFEIIFGGCIVPGTLNIKVTGKNENYSFVLNAKNRGDFIVSAKMLMNIKNGKYLLEITPDASDHPVYFGQLELF